MEQGDSKMESRKEIGKSRLGAGTESTRGAEKRRRAEGAKKATEKAEEVKTKNGGWERQKWRKATGAENSAPTKSATKSAPRTQSRTIP